MTAGLKRRPEGQEGPSPGAPDEGQRPCRPRSKKPRRLRVMLPTAPVTAPVEPPLPIGSYAVCPPHGVAEVIAIEEREISGIRDTFYRLRVMGTGARLLIPEDKLATCGLREIVDADGVDEVIALLRRRARPPSGSNWSKWHRTFTDRVRTGSVFEAAEVFRDIYALKQRKSLSPAERHLFDTALQLLVTELAAATGGDVDDAEQRVMDAVNRKRTA